MVETRTYTKVARAASEQRTRTALLDAAAELFFAMDWDDITLPLVAARAGVTKQTLLRHFGSKEGLLEQAYARAFDEVRRKRMGAPAGDIDAAVDNLLDHYYEDGDRALAIGAMRGGEVLSTIARNAREFHYAWVEHAFGQWLNVARGRRRKQLLGALVAICDVQTWAILARDMGLSRPDVRATLILTIRRVLEEDK